MREDRFSLTRGSTTSIAPPATADNVTRSQWLTRDAAARLAICNHLTLAECTHFGQHRTAQALYDAVVARYSSPTTTALGRLLLPYLFPELSAFATIEDLVSHLHTSNARYHATVPAEDHFLYLDPTSLTIDLLEQHLFAAETSAVAVAAARGTPHPPFFEGCSLSPLAPSYASVAAVDVPGAEDVKAASASAKRGNGKGKGRRGGGGGSGSRGRGSGGGSGGSGGGGAGGSGGGSGGVGGGGVSGGTGGGGTGARRGGSGGGQRQQQQRRSKTQSPQQLREWFLQRGASGGSLSYPYVIRTGDRVGQTCGRLHTQHRCFSRLDDAWRAEFGDDIELPRWAYLLRSSVVIFDLDFDAIVSAMYALSVNAECDCYQYVPPDPGIAAAALGASESGTLPGTAPAEALHTFMLDSSASAYFFRDSTTLTPLPAPVPVRLAHPSGGPVVACSSTVLPCPASAALQDAMVTTTTPEGHRVSICTCTRTGRHLATFTHRQGLSLYTLATKPSQVAASAQVSASGQVAASCSCCLLSHQTLLWHHRLGHPSLPRLRGMHSHLLVFGLPRSLPPLPPSPALPCLPSLRRRAAARRSSLLLVSPDDRSPVESPYGLDDYTCYTTIFPLRSKGQVLDLLMPWIRTVRLQLRKRFGQDLLVLRLHSDRGGDFSSDVLRDFCHGEGILQSFTLPDSPQQNGIAERRIGFVMEVARTSMIHAAAPHFLWPFAVSYAAHQLNLWPHKLSPHAIPFYHLFPYRSAPPPPPPFFLAPGPPPVDPLLPQGPAPSGAPYGGAASGGAEPGGAESEGAGSGGVEPGGEEPGGAEPAGEEPGGAEPEGVELGGVESEGAECGGSEPQGAASSGGRAGALPRLSPEELREWFVRRARLQSGAIGAGGAGDAGAGGGEVIAGAGGTGGTAAAGVGGTGAGGAGARGTEAVLGVQSSPSLTPPLLCPPPDQSQLPLQPASPLPAPSPYTEQSGGLTERPMALRPSSIPLRVPLPAPLESSLPEVPDLASDRARPASPTVARLLTTTVTDPSFESAAASALVAKLLDFAAACRLDYATALVAESESAGPPSVGAPPSDESIEPSGPYPELVGRLMYLMTCTRPDLAYPLSLVGRYVAPGRHRKVHWDGAKRALRYLCSTSGMGLVLGGRARVVLTGHADASSVDKSATQRSSPGYTFSLGSGSVSWRSTRSSLDLSSNCEAEIYAGAMAAQELRWLTYLLTYMGEQPRSPPVLYVDNKAMIALCQEHRLEHRTKHIALRYFLARELQQCGQLRLAYVTTRANTADIFTKALQSGASLAEVPVASVGTCVDTSPGAAPEDASLSFTLDSGASHCFFCDRTTLTPLPTSVSVVLADPISGPVSARYTTTLPCLAVPSGSLTSFHVPSFSRNLVGMRPLVSQHVGVWIEPSGETAVCVDGDTHAPLATFTAELGSGLFTLHTGP
ncbi:unnamed protein product [Closterium sp. NIES-54]